jgi:hypothetical protein
MKLRQRGIYCLPNGRELVVITGEKNGRFQLRGCERFEINEYEVDGAGRLLIEGKLTAWDLEHLKDTGRTAEQVDSAILS